MFYFLRGEVAEIGLNLAVLDCSGVGFRINTTTTTLSQLKVGVEAKLYTYCSIREDAFDIYGFYTKSELDAFTLLIGINGVGPSAALGILSAVTPDGLKTAVITQNEKMLTSAPRVGKKIAQRILLELKDKMGDLGLDAGFGTVGAPVAVSADSALAEATEALLALGFDRTTAAAALKNADVTGMDTQSIIKLALKRLS